MPVNPPANRSITPPAPGIPGKDPHAHNLDSNVYAAQAPPADGREGRETSPSAVTHPPAPPAAAQHDIDEQRAYEKKEKEKHDAEAKTEAQTAKKEAEGKRLAALAPADAFAFAIIDLQRGINRLRHAAAASIPGTYVHDAVLYFEAAVARMDPALDQARGGKRIDEVERARVMREYEQRYKDEVPEQVPLASPKPTPPQ